MNSIRRLKLLYFVIIGVVSMTTFCSSAKAAERTAPQATRSITLVYETTHNPPRSLGKGTSINWAKPGLTLELLRLVGDRLGVEFIYQRMPWKRGLKLVEKNKVDGIFHASYKEARESIGVYPKKDNIPDDSQAIFLQSYVLYKLKGASPEIKEGVISLTEGDIGVINNYSIGSDLRKNGHKVQEANTLEVNFNKLVRGRIAAFATLENMADDYLSRNHSKYSNVVKVKPALKTKPYYLLFSHNFVKTNPDLTRQIWQTIAELKKSDIFKDIIATY
jgi:polar amino acid transport system substrate-binding protein